MNNKYKGIVNVEIEVEAQDYESAIKALNDNKLLLDNCGINVEYGRFHIKTVNKQKLQSIEQLE